LPYNLKRNRSNERFFVFIEMVKNVGKNHRTLPISPFYAADEIIYFSIAWSSFSIQAFFLPHEYGYGGSG
jgi:hypothetical protein